MQNSERALVPLPSELTGLRAPDGRIDVPRLLAAAALGLAVEAQRRSLGAVAAVAGRVGRPLRVLARPAVAVTRGSVAVARHHLDLDGWAARGLAEQRRAQEAAVRAVRALIAALVAAVLDQIDLDEMVARIDLDQVVARIDLDRIVGRINPNQIAARIDLDEVVDRVDVDAIAKRINLDAIVQRIDLDAIVSRIDLDAIVSRVDIDAILARVDLPGLTEQVIEEVDLGEIIRESSSTMASETVDALRVQGMRVDGLVSRIVDRILQREGERETGPYVEELRP
ncbi:MAG TPA: hypothetical protein VHM23_20485 [Actinomycetota bacterium]|nr:hypothetical protein [Actinomycetota bacterium]